MKTLRLSNMFANHEKITMKLKHMNLEVILNPFGAHLWVLGRPLEDFFERLGTNLSQHKAILSHLGHNLRPTEANVTST